MLPRNKALFTGAGIGRAIRAATKPPIRWIVSANPKHNRSNSHVDEECCFSRLYVHPATPQFADAYSGRRRLAADRQNAGSAGRPEGTGRTAIQKIRAGLSQPSVRR